MSTTPTFTSNINQQLIETPKSTHGVFELPCGYIDNNGVVHTTVHLREMTGVEEDLLASAKIAPQKKLSMLLASCLVSVGTIEDKSQFQSIVAALPTGDRLFLMLAVRRISLGDEFPIEEKCPACDKKGNYTIDLSTLDIVPLKDRMVRVFDDKLPSGITVRHRISTGADEERVSKVADDERPTEMLRARTELLNGKAPTVADLKALSFRDRQALRVLMEERDAGVDTSVEMTCPHCQHDFKTEMDVGRTGFFFPGRVQKGSKQKSST